MAKYCPLGLYYNTNFSSFDWGHAKIDSILKEIIQFKEKSGERLEYLFRNDVSRHLVEVPLVSKDGMKAPNVENVLKSLVEIVSNENDGVGSMLYYLLENH